MRERRTLLFRHARSPMANMMRIHSLILMLMVVAAMPAVDGQDFGRRGRGERGDRDRGRNGDRDRGDRGRSGGDRGRFGRGGPGGFDPMSRLDANQNGRIDQEEIDRIPARVQEMMKARGFELNSGESVDDVRGRMRKRYEESRRRREGGDEKKDDYSDSGRDNRSTPPPAFKPRDRERMTVDLPRTYSEVDTDLDGQIGLYEWIVARRSDLELFNKIDRDKDSLLTPRELSVWEASQKQSEDTAKAGIQRERLVIVGSTPAASKGRKSDDRDSKSDSSERKDARQERMQSFATSSFGRLDSDGDGRISMDEWDGSRRTRSWFERSGVEIKAMSEKEFTRTFAELAKKKSS